MSFSDRPSLAYVFNRCLCLFLTTSRICVAHSGKELYKRFLSIPGTNPNPSQGGDPDTGVDPDVEIVQEDVKLPHLECLCLHLGDHTRDTDDVRPVSNFNYRPSLTHFLYVYLGRARKERNRHGHRHARRRPRRSEGDLALFGRAHECSDLSHEPPRQPSLGGRSTNHVFG